MTAEDLYQLRFVSDPQISPDGSQVVYVVAWVDPNDWTRYRSQLMLVPADGSASARALTSGMHRDSSPRWAPDGCSLAYLSDRDADKTQIFVIDMRGGEPTQLTSLRRGAGAPVWSPKGDRLAFSARVDVEAIAQQEGQSDEKGKQPRVRIVTRVRYKGDGEGFFEALRRHLFVIEVSGGKGPRQITDGDWDDVEPGWSPDGELIAFISSREQDRDLSLLNDVWVVPSRGGRARRLTRHRGQAMAPLFVPDGSGVLYLGHERGTSYGAGTGLLRVPIDGGGESTLVSEGFDDELSNVALSDTRDPFAVVRPRVLSDGSVLVLTSRFGRVEVVRFGIDGGEPSVVLGGDREVSAFSVSSDGQRLAFTASDPSHPYDVFVRDANRKERRLSSENDAFLSTIELCPVEPFQVTGSDGETVHGWLMKPRGFSPRKKWPLILEVHGGPEMMYASTFVHEFQVIAARGYALMYTNPRGSKGYGEAFTSRIFADWGNQDAADCMAAVDFASGLRWVDPTRLGLTGGSYGGFMTAWLVGHFSERFRAAVAQRGLYNWASFYGTSDIGPWFGDYVFGGPVYEHEALYRERSPLTYASRMRTPLLLIHNEMDLRCPMEQAEQLFVQLRRIGKCEIELVRFPEESHNLSRSGRPDRRVERLQRIYGWFDSHLNDERA